MARYLVVEFQDNESADKLLQKIHEATRAGALYRVVGLFVKPSRVCQCVTHRSTNYQNKKPGRAGVLYGRKFGWWVCTECNRPRRGGHQLINQLPGEELYPDTGSTDREWIITNLDLYSQDKTLVKRLKPKKKKKKEK